jgi:hypothetical protein
MSNNHTQHKEVKMKQVKSLEKMEKIVSKSKSLSWDGWNVVELIKNPGAMFKSNAARINGVWYIKNIFIVDQDGWRIPSKYAE